MFFNLPTLLTWARIAAIPLIVAVFHWPGLTPVSYTHLTLPTTR